MAKLQSANGAIFDSHLDEYNARNLSSQPVAADRGIADKCATQYILADSIAGAGKSMISR
jgi:hypothetical protein